MVVVLYSSCVFLLIMYSICKTCVFDRAQRINLRIPINQTIKAYQVFVYTDLVSSYVLSYLVTCKCVFFSGED